MGGGGVPPVEKSGGTPSPRVPAQLHPWLQRIPTFIFTTTPLQITILADDTLYILQARCLQPENGVKTFQLHKFSDIQ